MVRSKICKCKHMMSDHSVNQHKEYTFCVMDGCDCKLYKFDHAETHLAGITPNFERLLTNPKKKHYNYKKTYSMNNLGSDGRPRNP